MIVSQNNKKILLVHFMFRRFMKQFNVVLCETNGSLSANVAAFFAEDNDINLVVCASFSEAKEALRVDEQKGLILDVEFEHSKEIALAYRERNAAIILVSKNMEDDVDGMLSSMPYDACFYKPYSFMEMRTSLMRFMIQQTVSVKLNSGIRNIDERLSGIFIRAGIPPHIKGYQFLREAVKLAVAYPEMINSITKKLYPTIAQLYMTSSSKVERAIRHAIEVAWNRGKIENINAIFGIKIYNKGEKPTNGELIALVADKIMIESM